MLGLEHWMVQRGLETGDLLHHEGWCLAIGSRGWLRAHKEIGSQKTILEARLTELRGRLRQLEEHLRCASDQELRLAILKDKVTRGQVLVTLHGDLRELIERDNSLLARRCMSRANRARANEAPPPDEMRRRADEPPDEMRRRDDEDTPGQSSGYKDET